MPDKLQQLLLKSKMHVLIVDDDPIQQKVISLLLKSLMTDPEISYSSNGREALEQFNNETTIDYAFVDLHMPVMDGWELLKILETRLNPEKKSPKIFVLSSTISPEEIDRVHRFKTVEDFIIKPLTKEILSQIIYKHH